MYSRELRPSRVVFGVFVGCALFAIVFSLWYWAYVWLPQKESRAMQAHFKTVEKQWLLKNTINDTQSTTDNYREPTEND
jgi:uncharacterized iron-regulated membrane protein